MARRSTQNPASATRRRRSLDVLARFTLDVRRDGKWYVGQLRELPAVISQGRTMDSLRRNLRDAYREVMKATGAHAPRA